MTQLRVRGGWFVALFISAAAFVTSVIADKLQIGVAAAIPGFMLLALLASWMANLTSASVVTLVSTLCLDYYFTTPKYSFIMYSAQDILALTSFAAVSLVISHMVQRIKSATRRVELKEREQRALFELSQSILISDWKEGPEEHLCRVVREQLQLKGVAFWDEKSSRYWFSGEAADAESTLAAAVRAQQEDDAPSREEHTRIVRFGAQAFGAILFRGHCATPLFISAVAALIATNLARIRAMQAEVLAESVSVSEKMRTAVLDGLAHSVKTPLTTIAISASGLLELGDLSPFQRQFVRTIEEQALSLSETTNKLLRTSRLEQKHVKLRRSVVDLKEMYEAAAHELPQQLGTNRLRSDFPQEPIKISSDPEVFRLAILQLLENGLKYSPADSVVTVTGACTSSDVQLAVHNQDSFIPAEERQLIFERYYRGASTSHRATGTGLGLCIAKRAMEMHQGTVVVESSQESGTTFRLSIPKGE